MFGFAETFCKISKKMSPLGSVTLLIIHVIVLIDFGNCLSPFNEGKRNDSIVENGNQLYNQTTKLGLLSQQNKIEFVYDENLFFTHKPNSLDARFWLSTKGNVTNFSIFCASIQDDKAKIRLKVSGTKIKYSMKTNGIHFTGSSEFPVFKLECELAKNKSISNSTLIYTGRNEPPFLYKSGTSLNPILNETTSQFPCVLHYPVNHTRVELQLLKNGILSANTQYIPESGFFLKLNKEDFRDSIGDYECKLKPLADSTHNRNDNDSVSLTITESDFIFVRYDYNNIYTNETKKFKCKLPQSIYKNHFDWYYRLTNGSYVPILAQSDDDEYQNTGKNLDSGFYENTKQINFPATNIAEIVCGGTIIGSNVHFNNSILVNVKNGSKPQMSESTRKSSTSLTFFDGMVLACEATGDPPLNWVGLKDDHEITVTDIDVYTEEESPEKFLIYPSNSKAESKYTCRAYNSLGFVEHSFIVKPKSMWRTIIVTLAIVVLVSVFTNCLYWYLRKEEFDMKVPPKMILSNDELVPRKTKNDKGEEIFVKLGEGRSASVWLYEYRRRERRTSHSLFERLLLNFKKNSSVPKTPDNIRLIPVAVKKLTDYNASVASEEDDSHCSVRNVEATPDDKDNLRFQIKVMEYLGPHPNIVEYIGAVLESEMMLVMEHCVGGSLLSYLHNNRKFFSNGDANNILLLYKWAGQLASGVACLSNNRRKRPLLHMDTSLRNVLLGYNKGYKAEKENSAEVETTKRINPHFLVAKITDFDLSRFEGCNCKTCKCNQAYYQKMFHLDSSKNKQRHIPTDHAAIESLEDARFSTKSDVWAIGVTLYEIFTLGDDLYEDVIVKAEREIEIVYGVKNLDSEKSKELFSQIIFRETVDYLKKGNRLKRPTQVPIHDQMWKLMQRCWDKDFNKRPTPQEVADEIQQIILDLQNELLQVWFSKKDSSISAMHNNSNANTPSQASQQAITTTGYYDLVAVGENREFALAPK